jgi:DNA invertase Pin-like site-specific DNA recombinase
MKKAIVYLRSGCDRHPCLHEGERDILIQIAKDAGYEADVLEEVRAPGSSYAEARRRLRCGEAFALFVRDIERLGRTYESWEDVMKAMRDEGWRLFTRSGEIDQKTLCLLSASSKSLAVTTKRLDRSRVQRL